MKIIIHVGMHKTGSSSIQHTFSRLSHPDIEYIKWSIGGNHSALYVLLFEDLEKLSGHHSFKARGPEFTRTLPALRKQWHARVSAQLAEAGDRTIVFSGEDISSPAFGNGPKRLRDFFSDWSTDISVIGYARPPASFMSSMFQQLLKGGSTPDLVDRGVSPRYRARFERIDSIFGRNTVHLKEFSPSRLVSGDVVQDFASEIGVAPLQDDQIIRDNESLSLEAAAILYVQRKMGQGFVQGFEGAHAANSSFIARLARIGRRKLAFSTQMLAPILEKQRDDIAWIEDRLGHPFSEPGAAHRDAIDSLDDLVDIAMGQFDAVQELLGDAALKDGPANIETLVRALERLREQCYAQVVGAQGATQSLQKKGNTSMATKTDRPQPTEEELHQRRVLARILWHSDQKENMPSDLAERKKAYDLVKKNYHRKALELTQRLKNNNLMIVETEPQD